MDNFMNKFKNSFISCFESDIINNDEVETVVEAIDPEIKQTNKGHGIAFVLKDTNFGPIFYLETLMQMAKRTPLKELVHDINSQISEFHKMNINIQSAHNLEPDENVILTAVPIPQLAENYGLDDVEYFKREDIGLYIFVKTEVPDSPVPMAYGHTRKLTDDEMLSTIDLAKNNTMKHAKIEGVINKISDEIPPLMFVADTNGFADYFYLVHENVLADIAAKNNFRKLYILPTDAYHATMICIPTDMSEKAESDHYDIAVKKMILNLHYNNNDQGMPAIVYDVATTLFTKIEKENV